MPIFYAYLRAILYRLGRYPFESRVLERAKWRKDVCSPPSTQMILSLTPRSARYCGR